MQGMGRATRSRTDRATVLLSGQSLIDFSPTPITGPRSAPSFRQRSSTRYGSPAKSTISATSLTTSSPATSLTWRHTYETLPTRLICHLRQAPTSCMFPRARKCSRVELPGAAPTTRRPLSRDAAAALSSAAVKSSRIVQKSLAASFAALHASEQQDTTATLWALELARDATAASRTGNWKPRFTRIPVPEGAEAPARALRIIERLRRSGAEGRTRTDRERTLRRLANAAAAEYEEGIRHLGVMLGFESIRPGGSAIASPDGCWRDGETVVGWEAKSEQLAGGEISPKLVRQANTHGSWITANLGWEDDAELIVMVSPRADVQPTAVQLADPALALATVTTIEQLAARASEAEQFVAERLPGVTGPAAIQLAERALAERRLTTPELLADLGASRIRALSG